MVGLLTALPDTQALAAADKEAGCRDSTGNNTGLLLAQLCAEDGTTNLSKAIRPYQEHIQAPANTTAEHWIVSRGFIKTDRAKADDSDEDCKSAL